MDLQKQEVVDAESKTTKLTGDKDSEKFYSGVKYKLSFEILKGIFENLEGQFVKYI